MVAIVGIMGCDSGQADWPYDLTCKGMSTENRSAVVCLRLKTSDGTVHAVDTAKLPKLGSSTVDTKGGKPGLYRIACGTGNTPKRANITCLRLNRQTGELVSIQTDKLERLPKGN
jgi:hypothetical protein